MPCHAMPCLDCRVKTWAITFFMSPAGCQGLRRPPTTPAGASALCPTIKRRGARCCRGLWSLSEVADDGDLASCLSRDIGL